LANYYLFLDESGCDNIKKINKNFPVFNLTGVLFTHENYLKANGDLDNLKVKYFGNTRIIFHSFEIRKHQKEFVILENIERDRMFTNSINDFFNKSIFRIFSAIIKLNEYKEKYGDNMFNAYDLTFKIILDRVVGYLNYYSPDNTKLFVIIESRGNRLDKSLKNCFNKIMLNGSDYLTFDKFHRYKMELFFRSKRQNINGLQVSDLVASPISRCVLNGYENEHYQVCKSKIHKYGLYVLPQKTKANES